MKPLMKVSDVPAEWIVEQLVVDGWSPIVPPRRPRPAQPAPDTDAFHIVETLGLASPDRTLRMRLDVWTDGDIGAGFNAHLWALGVGAPGFDPEVLWCVDLYRSPHPVTVLDAARAAAAGEPKPGRPLMAAEVLRRQFWHVDGKSNNDEIVNRRGAEVVIRRLRPRTVPFLWEMHLQDERLWTALATSGTPIVVIAALVRRRRAVPAVTATVAPGAGEMAEQVKELRYRLAVIERLAVPIECGPGDDSLIGAAIREVASGRRTPQQAVADLGDGFADTLDGLNPAGC